MNKLLYAIWILLIVSGVILSHGQRPTANGLSAHDKADIIESVIELELKNQASVPDFANIRTVSSDNIEFVESSRISKHGFILVEGRQLRETKKDHVVEYLAFRRIYLRDDVVIVVLSRVTEGRPCFGAPFSMERSYTYESRQTVGKWVTRLIGSPAPVFSFERKHSVTKR
jgi:hypothetical protein